MVVVVVVRAGAPPTDIVARRVLPKDPPRPAEAKSIAHYYGWAVASDRYASDWEPSKSKRMQVHVVT